jgi:hypothetical protein
LRPVREAKAQFPADLVSDKRARLSGAGAMEDRMQSWWEFGDGSGYEGNDPYYRLTCAFCGQRGNFAIAAHVQKVQPNGHKKLNYDIATCANCSNAHLVFWSVALHSGRMPTHGVLQVPWPLGGKADPSENWPEQVGRYCMQAKDNLARNNYEMAIVAARTSLQCVARDKGAAGRNLAADIDDVARNADLPTNMKEWAHVVIRDPGNENAHPAVGQPAATRQEARDVIGYLDFLLEYVYDLPAKIQEFRERPNLPA